MYQIGIDIGGTNIKIGIVNENAEIVAQQSIPFPHENSEIVAAQISNTIHLMLKQPISIALSAINSIGIVIPGSIDPSGERIVDAYNLNFHNVPFRSMIETHFPNIPVFMANDADGAAFAELYHGAFVGCKNAVLLTLGTGLGGGIIVNGKIFRGGLNHGVELGHAYLIYGGKPCSCGNSGCAEAYCSASALASLAVNAMHKYPESLVYPKSNGDADAIDAKFLVDCAKAADPIALNIWNKYLDYLSSFCASIFNILDPEVLAIGGGLCGAGDFLFEPLRQLTSQKCFYKTHGNIVPAVLGNNAGIIGAAMLWNNQF